MKVLPLQNEISKIRQVVSKEYSKYEVCIDGMCVFMYHVMIPFTG